MMIKVNVRAVLVGVLLMLVLAGGVLFLKKGKAAALAAQKRPPLPVGMAIYKPRLKVKGSDASPVKIVEFSDFECPSCRMSQDALKELFRKYPGAIQLTFMHFPLQSHRWSIYAHQASECMNAQGKFWNFHDKVYDKQRDWSASAVPPVEILIQYAQENGADMTRFSACLSDVAVTREIYSEKEEGARQQVNATPTFFIAGQRFVGPKELKERGENMIRAILGLPPIPVVVTEPVKNPPPKPAVPLKK